MGSDGWRSLGDRYYQKQELVAEMEWPEVDLSMYMVAGAKFGGPVALKRDKSKPVPIGKDAPPHVHLVGLYVDGFWFRLVL